MDCACVRFLVDIPITATAIMKVSNSSRFIYSIAPATSIRPQSPFRKEIAPPEPSGGDELVILHSQDLIEFKLKPTNRFSSDCMNRLATLPVWQSLQPVGALLAAFFCFARSWQTVQPALLFPFLSP